MTSGKEPSETKTSSGNLSNLGKALGYIVGIPIALALLVATLGGDIQEMWQFGKVITGNAADCKEVGEYLDEVIIDYEALIRSDISNMSDYERVTENAVRHLRRLDPPKGAEDFHNATLEYWLYMRDDFTGDVQRTVKDDVAFEALTAEVTDDVTDATDGLLRDCPQETRAFERSFDELNINSYTHSYA